MKFSLNDIDAIETLEDAMKKIISSSEDNSFTFYLEVLCELGIYDDKRSLGFNDIFKKPTSKMNQELFQFATLLSFLSQQYIENVCELGTFEGWQSALICSVLKKKNDVKLTVIDDNTKYNKDIENLLNKFMIEYKFISGTSESLKDEMFDLTILDLNYSYEKLLKDWENIGQNSKITILTNINDYSVIGNDRNGPSRLFNLLERNKMSILSEDFVRGYGVVFNYI